MVICIGKEGERCEENSRMSMSAVSEDEGKTGLSGGDLL